MAAANSEELTFSPPVQCKETQEMQCMTCKVGISPTDMYQNMLDDTIDSEMFNSIFNQITERLYKSAKASIKPVERPKTFVSDISDICDGAVMENANMLLENYLCGNIGWQEWEEGRKVAVTHLGDKYNDCELQKWKEILQCNDAKQLWAGIKWNGDKEVKNEMPDAEDLASHFKTKGDDENEVISKESGSNYVEILDADISIEEIDMAAKKLKSGKATADGWTPLMISVIQITIFPLLKLLFNYILKFGIFPVQWWSSVITAVFKGKGRRQLANNYRPVSLVVMMCKLFDFILLERFKLWFKPHDNQTAYQEGKSCSDHVFILRCVIEFARKIKIKLFTTALDFDGAFDRVKRNTLLKKLILFGAGSCFIACIANIYRLTEYTVCSNGSSCTYVLLSGIKQGLPLSPFLFLFYIDDIHDYFAAIYSTCSNNILDELHLLMHADDATLLGTSRNLMSRKLNSMMVYCKRNNIVLQLSKCYFIVVNGTVSDCSNFQLSNNESISNCEYLTILGSPISGNLKSDLDLHMQLRFKNVIKYFNFLKSNKKAPVCIKLKVLKACVMSTLLYNCEAFGPKVPDGLEELYFKMLRSALNVRPGTPNSLLLIETGFLPIKAMIYGRQWKFMKRFRNSMLVGGARSNIFQSLLGNVSEYLKHYID